MAEQLVFVAFLTLHIPYFR